MPPLPTTATRLAVLSAFTRSSTLCESLRVSTRSGQASTHAGASVYDVRLGKVRVG